MTKRNFCGRTLIMTAMAELIYQDQTCIEHGVPPHRLLRAIFSSKDNAGLTKKYLEAIIEREFNNRGIVMMDNGNYSLGPRDLTKMNMEMGDANVYSYNGKMGSSNNSSPELSPVHKYEKKKSLAVNKGEMAIRVGERRKRARKVFDPSENNLPSKRRRGRPMGSLNKTTIKKYNQNVIKTKLRTKSDSIESSNEDEVVDQNRVQPETSNKCTGGVCSVCRQYRSAKDDLIDDTDKLIECRDCSNKAHPSCLKGDGMLRLGPDNTWQCPHCKTCIVCIETTDAGVLTVCNLCSDAYHASCHNPPISERLKAWNLWECKHCTQVKPNAQNLETYGEKPNSSDRSSKLSDRSDTTNSLDRRKDRSSVKNENGDDISDKPKFEKDRSFSPIYKDNSKWQYSRRLASPVTQTVYEWKQEDDDNEMDNNPAEPYVNTKAGIIPEPDVYSRAVAETNTIRETIEESTELRHSDKNNHNSIFMNNHDLNKLYNNSIYQKNQNNTANTNDIDLSIPDAELWSYNDVYQYFLSYFPEQAHIFKDQLIDGQSLLVMKRSDVISRLGLPLGPALKIYRHVVRLQTRKDDITMCWL